MQGECVNLREETIADMAMEELVELTRTTKHWERDTDRVGAKWKFIADQFQSKFFIKNNVTAYPIIMEATRTQEEIQMDASDVIYTMMNPEKWAATFGIVAQVSKKEELRRGDFVTGDGSMWKIEAVLHLMSPFIPSRKVTFIRSCRKVEENSMAIVDISVVAAGDTARRLPSGLLVRSLGTGRCHVTWVERSEFNINTVSDSTFKSFVIDYTGYSSRRFIAVLKQKSEEGINSGKLAALSSSSSKSKSKVAPPRTILKLAKRMYKGFFQLVSDKPGTGWKVLLAEPSQRVMTYRLANPKNMVVSSTAAFFVPSKPVPVFERVQYLFRANQMMGDARRSFDVVEEFEQGISLLRGYVPPCMMLQQSRVLDNDTAFLLYSSSSDFCDGDCIELITSGVTIQDNGQGGSFVTVCIQAMSDALPDDDECSNASLVQSAKGQLDMITEKINSGGLYHTPVPTPGTNVEDLWIDYPVHLRLCHRRY